MCPYCSAEASRVVDSRLARDQHAIRRRRECDACGKRFTTYERAELSLPTVLKRDGRRQAFDRHRLHTGVALACRKRGVSAAAIEALIADVEHDLAQMGDREVTTRVIGDRVLSRLRGLDEVAYVRFASVYREFSDVAQFLTELDALHRAGQP